MNIMNNKVLLEQDEVDELSDVFIGHYDTIPTKEQLESILNDDVSLMADCLKWGCGDTVVRDDLCVNLSKGKYEHLGFKGFEL